MTEVFPDVAVTVIGYVFLGVPVAGLSCGLALPTTPPQAAIADSMASTTRVNNCGAYRRAGKFANPRANQSATQSIATTQTSATLNNACGHQAPGKRRRLLAVCGIVVITSVTGVPLLPAESDVGENVAAALGGIGETKNLTSPARVPFVGDTTNAKLAGWPAETDRAPV